MDNSNEIIEKLLDITNNSNSPEVEMKTYIISCIENYYHCFDEETVLTVFWKYVIKKFPNPSDIITDEAVKMANLIYDSLSTNMMKYIFFNMGTEFYDGVPLVGVKLFGMEKLSELYSDLKEIKELGFMLSFIKQTVNNT